MADRPRKPSQTPSGEPGSGNSQPKPGHSASKHPESKAQKSKRQASGLRAVAAQLGRVTAEVRRKRGLTEGALMADWPTIVGDELAAECVPQRLVRGADGTGGTLHIRVTGPLALELQYLEPLVIERINGYFGYRAIARLTLHQGPIAVRPTRKQIPRPHVSPSIDAHLAPQLANIGDDALRDALSRLGREVISRQPMPTDGETGDN